MNLEGLTRAEIARKIYIEEIKESLDFDKYSYEKEGLDFDKYSYDVLKEIEEMDDDEIIDGLLEYYAAAGFSGITMDYIIEKCKQEPIDFKPYIEEKADADIARIVYTREFIKLLEQGMDVKSDLEMLETMTDEEVVKAVVELFECLGFENVTIEGIVADYKNEQDSLNF
jgi:hypothetical protein